MTDAERENWLCNLQETATIVARQTSRETVYNVLSRYGATSIEKLNPGYYSDVFSDLYAIEAASKD